MYLFNLLRKIPTSVRIVLIILLTPLLTCVGLYLFMIISHDIFTKEISAAEPRYIQLNMSVFNSIPVPKEAKEVNRDVGSILIVNYEFKRHLYPRNILFL